MKMKNMAIAAISTPPGMGGIAVIRLSGKDALEVASKVWKGKPFSGLHSHTAHVGTIHDMEGSPIDQAVATLFRAPNSFTGEDTVEFSVHGSPWIQKAVMKAVIEAGASPAGPGEFTKTAFINGRLDLAQAEAVADLLGAESHAAAKVALTQIGGSYSAKLNSLRESLVELGALLELELDFSEEEVEFADRSRLRAQSEEIRREVVKLSESYRQGKIYKEGISVALAGVPNAGKSSLLNELTGEEKAIVTDIPGTTRDVLDATLEINGILYRIYDTAGLHESDDPVETIGIDRARERIGTSQILIWLADPTQPLQPQLSELRSTLEEATPDKLIIGMTKSDLCKDSKMTEMLATQVSELPEHGMLRMSAKTGEGIETLKEMMGSLGASAPTETETLVTNLRHYEALKEAQPYLDRLLEGLETLSPDLLAEELRGALRHISSITGAVTTPDLLHHIFSHFCIGK